MLNMLFCFRKLNCEPWFSEWKVEYWRAFLFRPMRVNRLWFPSIQVKTTRNTRRKTNQVETKIKWQRNITPKRREKEDWDLSIYFKGTINITKRGQNGMGLKLLVVIKLFRSMGHILFSLAVNIFMFDTRNSLCTIRSSKHYFVIKKWVPNVLVKKE